MEITIERLDEIIKNSASHKRALDWGERAFIANVALADVIYWDTGNSWCDVLHVVPKEQGDKWRLWFFAELRRYDQMEFE